MSKKQLTALLLCSIVYWTVGNGIVPLLPVFTESLGADTAMAGYSLSVAYLALAAGAMAAGWLVGRVRSLRRLLVLSTLLSPPFLFLMGQATNIVQLVICMSLIMFLGGLGIALISILAGYSAGEQERGRVFGALAVTGSVGMLLGGLGAGPATDAWGYPGLFAAGAAFSLLNPLLSLLVEDPPAAAQAGATAAPSPEAVGEKPGLGNGFWLLFLAAVVAMAANVASQIGRSLAMNDLGFNATAISSTVAVSGVITLPLPLLAGWLSDRVGRRLILGVSYVAVTLALLVLANAVELWHFWAVIALATVQSVVGGAVTPALGADLAPRPVLGRAMALLSVTTWVGGILGFGATGEAVKRLGLMSTMLLSAALPLVGLVLLAFIRRGEAAKDREVPQVREM
jgi:MFS family permease